MMTSKNLKIKSFVSCFFFCWSPKPRIQSEDPFHLMIISFGLFSNNNPQNWNFALKKRRQKIRQTETTKTQKSEQINRANKATLFIPLPVLSNFTKAQHKLLPAATRNPIETQRKRKRKRERVWLCRCFAERKLAYMFNHLRFLS